MWGLIIAFVLMLLGFKIFGAKGFTIVTVLALFVLGAMHTGRHYQTKDQG